VLSTTEAEYISVASCYAWIKNELEDYNIYKSKIPIFYYNKFVISLSQKPTLHSREKYIEIKHHFIRDYIYKGTVDLQFVPTSDQLVNCWIEWPKNN